MARGGTLARPLPAPGGRPSSPASTASDDFETDRTGVQWTSSRPTPGTPRASRGRTARWC